jgi:hypothetical protein
MLVVIWCPQVCVLWPHRHVYKVILTATQHIPTPSGHRPQGYYPTTQIRRGPKEEAFPYILLVVLNFTTLFTLGFWNILKLPILT